MPFLEFIGAMALTVMHSIVITPSLENINTKFAAGVDSGNSCWDRIGGEVGTYGSPDNYSLDLLCNWRLKKEVVTKDVMKYTLTRG